jgi:hypothetical protein
MRPGVKVGVVVALFVLAAAVRADEEKVPLDKLPKAVVEAVKKRFPKGEMKSASKEKEDGKTMYEVSVKEGGKNIDVSLTEAGEITTIEKEIAFKDLPKAVADAYEAKYPKATYKTVEEVIKVKGGKETLEYYEALLVTADKKTFEVEVTPDGNVKNVEEKKGKSD